MRLIASEYKSCLTSAAHLELNITGSFKASSKQKLELHDQLQTPT